MPTSHTLASYTYKNETCTIIFHPSRGLYELVFQGELTGGRNKVNQIKKENRSYLTNVQNPRFNWRHYLVSQALTRPMVYRDALADVLSLYAEELTNQHRIGASFIVAAELDQLREGLTQFGVQHPELQIIASPVLEGKRTRVILANPNKLGVLIPHEELIHAFEFIKQHESPQNASSIDELIAFLGEVLDETPLQLLYWESCLKKDWENFSSRALATPLSNSVPGGISGTNCVTILAFLCNGTPLESLVPWFS